MVINVFEIKIEDSGYLCFEESYLKNVIEDLDDLYYLEI